MNKGQKIPEIIVSNTEDSINGGNLVYKLTLEEFYDLMHHTHKLEDLQDENGILFPPVSPMPPSSGNEGIAPLPPEQQPVSLIQQLQINITNLSKQIVQLEAKISDLENTIESNNAEINSKVDNYIDGDLTIGDWDATTPEIDKIP